MDSLHSFRLRLELPNELLNLAYNFLLLFVHAAFEAPIFSPRSPKLR